jgi:hypothetical protein
MPRPLRKINCKSRAILLAEFNRLRRQERAPSEQMIERFLQCEDAQQASKIAASLTEGKHRSQHALPTPSGLLPWLH